MIELNNNIYSIKSEKNNRNILISIVIPCHNSSQFITQCLDSIINQTYKNIEIICIDDYSTDTTYQILQQYKILDSRIKILQNKTNLFAGYSRNIGIYNSHGEYILFIDSDDFCEYTLVEKIVKMILLYHGDICAFNIDRYDTKTSIFSKCYFNIPTNLCNINLRKYQDNKFMLVTPGPIKAFKRQFILENNIMFSEKIHNTEDVYFMTQALAYAKNISIIHENLYHYRKPTSLTTNESTRSIYIEDPLIAFNNTTIKIFKTIHNKNIIKNYIEYICTQIYYSYCILTNIAKNIYLYLLISKYQILLFDNNKINKLVKIYNETLNIK